MSTDYGTDISTLPDLDETFSVVESPERVIAEQLIRRLSTDTGSVEWDKNAGYNLTSLLNDGLDERELPFVRTGIERECEQHPMVAAAQCVLELDDETETLTASITIEAIEGEVFTLVASISALTISLLQVS